MMSLGSRFKEVPSPKNTEYISPSCLLLLSPSPQLSAKDKSRKLLMTCIHCVVQKKKKKSPFRIFGIRFEGSCCQLNAFIIRFFWSKPAALCDSLHIFVSYGKANCSSVCLGVCVCLPAAYVCGRRTSSLVCVWVRETSVIVGLLHPDNWKPDGLKITQRFPILSSFGTASSVCFDFCVRPPGMLGVTGGRFLSHGPLSWCPQLFLNSLEHTQK